MPKAKGLYTKGIMYSIVEAHDNNKVLMKLNKTKER